MSFEFSSIEFHDCPDRLMGVYCDLPAEVVCRYQELVSRALVECVIMECVEGHVYRGSLADLADLKQDVE